MIVIMVHIGKPACPLNQLNLHVDSDLLQLGSDNFRRLHMVCVVGRNGAGEGESVWISGFLQKLFGLLGVIRVSIDAVLVKVSREACVYAASDFLALAVVQNRENLILIDCVIDRLTDFLLIKGLHLVVQEQALNEAHLADFDIVFVL